MIKRKLSVIFVIVIYLFLAATFTYPLILHLKSVLPGWPLDAFDYLWNIDTFWYEIFQHHNPFFTQRIFYPIGANLIMHTYAPFISLFGLPFLHNLTTYMNLVILASIVGNALTMFLLVRYLTRNKAAAFLSSLFYGFSPIMFSFIQSQHYHFLVASVFLPLAIMEILKFRKSQKIRRLIFLVIIFWIIFFTEYYNIILLGVFSLSFLAGVNLKKILNYKSFLVILLGLVFPLLLFIKTNKLNSWSALKSQYSVYCSTKPGGFLIPSDLNPFLNKTGSILYETFKVARNFDTPSYFLGWITLMLVSVSIIKSHKDKYFWGFLTSGIIIFLLTLGTKSVVFTWLSKLPFMGLVDCPQRFVAGIQLSIAVLVGYLFSSIRPKTKLIKNIILVTIIIVFLVEYGTVNLTFSPVTIPSVYKELKDYPDTKTVLEIPSGIAESKGAFGYDWSIPGLLLKQLYWQTIYQKPRAGGYLSRLPSDTYRFYRNTPIINDLFTLSSLDGTWPQNTYSSKEIEGFLKLFNLGYIILSPNQRQKDFEKIIDKTFMEYISSKKSSEGFILYRIKTD